MSEPVPSSDRPAFRGKIVVATTRSRGATSLVVLSECSFTVVGGRLFLVGTSWPAFQSMPEWSDGLRRRIAWDAVEEYLLFDSEEDYYERQPMPPAQSLDLSAGAALPLSEEGIPVEPTDVYVDVDTQLDIGSTVLAFSQGRWWRAEIVAFEKDDRVRVHFPGWDSTWDQSYPREELQVDLGY